MNWNAISAIGEILGTIAVFGSLMYLAIQIRASNANARVESRERANEVFDRWRSKLVMDKELGEIWQKGIIEPDSMTDEESFRFQWLVGELIHNLRVMYLRAYDLKQPAELERITSLLKLWVPQPGFQWNWPRIRKIVEPEFIEVVEKIANRQDT